MFHCVINYKSSWLVIVYALQHCYPGSFECIDLVCIVWSRIQTLPRLPLRCKPSVFICPHLFYANASITIYVTSFSNLLIFDIWTKWVLHWWLVVMILHLWLESRRTINLILIKFLIVSCFKKYHFDWPIRKRRFKQWQLDWWPSSYNIHYSPKWSACIWNSENRYCHTFLLDLVVIRYHYRNNRIRMPT